LPNTLVATGVTGYYAEGGRTSCPSSCFFSDLVFYGATRQAYFFNNLTGITSGVIYTSTDPSARVFSLTADGNNLFLLERRDADCFPFTCYQYVIVRSGRSNENNKAPIYNTPALGGSIGPDRLTTDGVFLFWQENQNASLLRLPNDASALPQTNMRITGMEVTQGIQSLNNNVFLVKNRRTFVRVYVKSDGPSVSGVTARLSATWNGGGSVLPLLPVNPAKGKLLTQLTVQPGPNRDDINQSFLFDLPLDWTTQTNLVLQANLNPYKVPLQTDYSNNTMQYGPLTFRDSPSMSGHLGQFQYLRGNNTFCVPMSDTLQAVSLARRMYPLASTAGWYTDQSAGFRQRLWKLFDAGLGARMNFSASECNNFLGKDDNGNVVDNRNLCPTAYANNQLKAFRSEQGLGDKAFAYGLIAPAPMLGLRGQAFSDDLVASGASSNSSTAVHEIAHTAGRNHPFKGSSLDTKVCGNTPSDGAMDNNYPYANSSIGPPDGSYEGFDTGDPSLAITPTVRPGKQWFDIIGYCGPRWIGDYTYRGIYKFFFPNAPVSVNRPAAPRVSGDWLSVLGLIAASAPMRNVTPDPALLARAERMVEDGRGRDLLPWDSTPAGAGTMSAQSYVNRARVGIDVYGVIAPDRDLPFEGPGLAVKRPREHLQDVHRDAPSRASATAPRSPGNGAVKYFAHPDDIGST